jgi:hypothetical protein
LPKYAGFDGYVGGRPADWLWHFDSRKRSTGPCTGQANQKNKGKDAVVACLTMLSVKRRLNMGGYEPR